MVIKGIETKKTTHIRVSIKVKDWLDKQGERNESFDNILKRLLKIKGEKLEVRKE